MVKEVVIWMVEAQNKQTHEKELCDMAGFHLSRKSAAETAHNFQEESVGWLYKPVKFVRAN